MINVEYLKKIKHSCRFTLSDNSERTLTSKRLGPGIIKWRCHIDYNIFIICMIRIEICDYTLNELCYIVLL